MRNVLVAVVALAGCEKAQDSVASDCAAAAATLIKALQTPTEKPPAQTHKVLTSHCADDRWSPQARTCFQGARTSESVDHCRYTQLTRQQDELLQPDLESIDPRPAEIVATTERLWTKMCACQDSTCAAAVLGELKTWTDGFARRRLVLPRLNAKQREQIKAMQEQFNKCAERAMGGSR